jgi:hypothetical protein
MASLTDLGPVHAHIEALSGELRLLGGSGAESATPTKMLTFHQF